MANIPLQSITFPGLSDKYTTPVVDNTLTQAGAAADAKKTGDEIAELKNDLSELSSAYSAFVVETETGSIASFSDGADDVPVKDLTVAIEPVQSGSGDPAPDNVRPISGWTGANVTKTGKNLFHTTAESKTEYGVTWSVNNDGTVSVSGTATGYTSFGLGNAIVNSRMGTVVISGISNAVNVTWNVIALYDVNDNMLYKIADGSTATSISVNLSEYPDAYRIFLSVKRRDDVAVSGVVEPQIELGSTATAYEPYQGETVSIDWTTEAGTVYGGTLDVTTGVLTVDRASVVLDGSSTVTWAYQRTNGDYYTTIELSGMKSYANSEVANIVSSVFGKNTASADTVYASTTFYGFYGNNTAGRIRLCLPDVSTTQEFSAWLAEYQPQVVYELATPQTYQLTPEEVSTVLSQNSIFADCGNVDVQYRADTKLYINKVLNA